MGLIICFLIIGHIWKKYYDQEMFHMNWEILKGQKIWAPFMEAMPGFIDFKGGCVFHLVFAIAALLLSHFFPKVSFLFFGIFGVYVALQFYTYSARSKYTKNTISDALSRNKNIAAKAYRDALYPYLTADLIYCLYAVYLLVVACIINAIW